MKKHGILLSLIFCILLALPTFAAPGDDSMDYSGPLDERTGLPLLDEEGAVDKENQTRFELNPGVYSYDSVRESYAIPVGNSEFFSNVPPGIVTTGELRFIIPNGLTAVLYRDGEKLDTTDFTYIRNAGAYALEVTGANLSNQALVYFTIVPPLTSAIHTYTLPVGFQVESLFYEDEEMLYSSANSVVFDKDGSYRLNIIAPITEERIYLSLEIDHTAPVINAEGVVNGQATGPVTLSCDDEAATFAVTVDDGSGPSTVNKLELTDPGRYVVTATDEAGNETTLKFEMLLYLNSYAIMVLLLIVGGMIALWLHLAFRKRHTRVG